MMIGNVLAMEILNAMGGKVTPERLKAFQALANAIVKHLQTNMQVMATGIDPQGGSVVTTSTSVT